MDEKIIRIVASKLRRYAGQPINQEKLVSIRAAVYSATRTNKSASFSNVKKWIKAARKYIKIKDKAKKAKKPAKRKAQKPKKAKKPVSEPEVHRVPKKVEQSVNIIKQETEPQQPAQEVALPKPTIVFDKVYLQGIKFEIAGIRQTMERVSRQLDRLEKELSEHEE